MVTDQHYDVREQDTKRCDLQLTLMNAVKAAIEAGLDPDKAKEAVQGVWDQEQRLYENRMRWLATL